MRPTPAQLLAAARHVLRNDETVLDGRREVTAAVLIRQAIESQIDDLIAAVGGDSPLSRRTQFLTLAAIHADPALVREVHHTWAQLSEVCHSRSYELPPTPSQLERWATTADRLAISPLGRARATGSPRSATRQG